MVSDGLIVDITFTELRNSGVANRLPSEIVESYLHHVPSVATAPIQGIFVTASSQKLLTLAQYGRVISTCLSV